MDMKQFLDKLRPSVSPVKIKVRETWTIKMENGKMVAERKQ